MRYFIYALILAIILCLTSCSNQSESTYRIATNEGIIDSEDFYVSANSTDLETYARGTVFIRADDADDYAVHIVAWIEIDPCDRGGIVFEFPFGWTVTGITSSYPDIRTNNNPEDYIEVWTTNSNYSEWRTSIRIGFCRAGRCPGSTRGGAGSIVIDLESSSTEPDPFPVVFKTWMGAGYEEREGYTAIWPDSITVELSLIRPSPDLS